MNYIGGARSAASARLACRASTPAPARPCPTTSSRPRQKKSTPAAKAAAARAIQPTAAWSAVRRAEFLEAIADELDALGDAFVAVVCRETVLPAARIQGERGRTSGQMRLFAKVLRRGDFYGARIEQALPSSARRCPVRTCASIALVSGQWRCSAPVTSPWCSPPPVATRRSALAAGCPVVFKAHSGHMATAEHVADAIIRAG